MMGARSERKRVYVLGAGFSKGFGFPLTSELLPRLWPRITDPAFKNALIKIIEFHHPGFAPDNFDTFPNIERLLSQIDVNIDLWKASRRGNGNFKKKNLVEARGTLLSLIADWFHEESKRLFSNHLPEWLVRFKKRLLSEQATIVSFNWDLVLDQLLFGRALSAKSYGFEKPRGGPILLKPHGSLNWYEHEFGRFLTEDTQSILFPGKKKPVHLFQKFRSPISKVGRKYDPLIVAPTFLKNFRKPIFAELWNKCIDAVGTAEEVIFVGYSLPESDFHARFILRCGFHDELDGLLLPKSLRKGGRTRAVATGPAKVTVVNPDGDSFERIKTSINSDAEWLAMSAESWVLGQ